jgi:MarR family transcriptional regulator, transcriptional regulator for hemolysin
LIAQHPPVLSRIQRASMAVLITRCAANFLACNNVARQLRAGWVTACRILLRQMPGAPTQKIGDGHLIAGQARGIMGEECRSGAALTNQVLEGRSQRLEFLLCGVARLLRRHFESKARGLHLNRTWCQALLYLHCNEGINQTCLAQLLDVKRIVRLIDKLQSAGLIERHIDPSDRRVWRLNLTPAGRAMVAGVRELGDLTRNEALAGLAPAEIDQLVKTLQVVKANLFKTYNSPAVEREGGVKTNLKDAQKKSPCVPDRRRGHSSFH